MKNLSCPVATNVWCAYNLCAPAVSPMELIVTRNKTEISKFHLNIHQKEDNRYITENNAWQKASFIENAYLKLVFYGILGNNCNLMLTFFLQKDFYFYHYPKWADRELTNSISTLIPLLLPFFVRSSMCNDCDTHSRIPSSILL